MKRKANDVRGKYLSKGFCFSNELPHEVVCCFSFNSSSPHPCLFSTLSNSWKTESMTLKRSTVSSGSK